MKSAIAMIGGIAVAPVWALPPGTYDIGQIDSQPVSLAESGNASYHVPLGRLGAIFGSAGVTGEPALGPPASLTRQFADVENLPSHSLADRLDATGSISQVFTLGYRWRSLQFEGSAFSSRSDDDRRPRNDSLNLASRSGRLSFRPASNLSFQLSRGMLSNLDLIENGGEVKRTTLSATYKYDFSDIGWQNTFAWGRNARKYQESSYGYLFESSVKLASAHALFGRVEQVGSDDMYRQNESNRREMFKLNKVTLGYMYDLSPGSREGMDVGAMLSRHLVPSSMTATYGNDPVSYMMFVRFKLK